MHTLDYSTRSGLLEGRLRLEISILREGGLAGGESVEALDVLNDLWTPMYGKGRPLYGSEWARRLSGRGQNNYCSQYSNVVHDTFNIGKEGCV